MINLHHGLFTIASSIIFVDTATDKKQGMTSKGHHVVALTISLKSHVSDSVLDHGRADKVVVFATLTSCPVA